MDNMIEVTKEDIKYFNEISSKGDNDVANKKRESIICNILNRNFPEDFFQDPQWSALRHGLTMIFGTTVSCEMKAGRVYNYDFLINNEKIEFKYNASDVSDTPQFVSPGKISEFFDKISYEEFYFDKYLPILANAWGLALPGKEEYLKHIGSSNPKCMEEYKRRYDGATSNNPAKRTNSLKDRLFSDMAKKIADDSIEEFILNNDLNISKLSEYLLRSQKDKKYLLYKNGTFRKQVLGENNYIIDECLERTKNTYKVMTRAGKILSVLLRWKNGKGIAFPAFQIRLLNN